MEDTGKEPNLTAKESWKSPDIWVRNQKDDVEEMKILIIQMNIHSIC